MADFRILAGYLPGERGDDALALAGALAAAARAPLTVAHVHAPPWPARGPGAVDAEWLAYLRRQGQEALDQAAARPAVAALPNSRVDYVMGANRGSGRGLIEAAEDVGAAMIVIGSAPRGRSGRIAIGSTADQLLHGSPVPVMLAPRGYGQDPPAGFERLAVAYWRRRGSGPALRAAAEAAGALRLPVRLFTLVLRPAPVAAAFRGADEMLRRQRDQAERDLAHAVELLGMPAETEVVEGADVPRAIGSMDWAPGDILACMSSNSGPLRKVFLGDASGKIVRSAPCPVLVLPRDPAR